MKVRIKKRHDESMRVRDEPRVPANGGQQPPQKRIYSRAEKDRNTEMIAAFRSEQRKRLREQEEEEYEENDDEEIGGQERSRRPVLLCGQSQRHRDSSSGQFASSN